MLRKNSLKFTLVAAFCAAPILLLGDVTGADPGYTAAPGDNQSACTSCHTGTRLNAGGGSVEIVLPNGSTYTPGVKQHIQVKVSDSSQKRWGFELTARVASSPSSTQAGDLTASDGNSQVRCANGRPKPCSSASVIQYITHTQTGTRLGTTGSATFDFDWTPPSTNVGNVTLYAAGNAANGNTQESGDHIYTTSVTLTPAATSTKPAITSSSGIVNAATFQASIAQNSWVTIYGSNLATTTRTWTQAEVAGGNLPTSLDGVSVTINGKAAYVEYISPTQINVMSPADTSSGPVEVKVSVNDQTSDAAIATAQTLSPGFFTFDGKYLAATHADNSLLGKPGLFPSAPTATTAAKPGETIVLYGTGFGPTNPSVAAGQLTTALSPISSNLSVTIGGQSANVTFGGLVPPYAGLYQFNVQVPAGLADGDQAVVAQVGTSITPAGTNCCFITVQK